ncbi:hypothetical protein DOY81_007153, partial [Sarcophaga bullata]
FSNLKTFAEIFHQQNETNNFNYFVLLCCFHNDPGTHYYRGKMQHM